MSTETVCGYAAAFRTMLQICSAAQNSSSLILRNFLQEIKKNRPSKSFGSLYKKL